jgi:hypothetical protein
LLYGDVPQPEEFVSDLPTGLAEIAMKGLSKDPFVRFPTAEAMQSALEAYPIATPSEVGRWVESHAVDSLTRRSIQMASMEGSHVRHVGSRVPISGHHVVLSPTDVTATLVDREAMTRDHTTSGRMRSRRGVLSAVAFAVVALGVWMAAQARESGLRQTTTPRAAAPATDTVCLAATAAIEAAAAVTAPPEAATVSTPSTPSTTGAAPTAATMSAAPRNPVKSGKPAATPVRARRFDCASATYVDEQGRTRFRTECL